MPVSKDTLLRSVRTTEQTSRSAPRVIGLDDWAWRKGRRTRWSGAWPEMALRSSRSSATPA